MHLEPAQSVTLHVARAGYKFEGYAIAGLGAKQPEMIMVTSDEHLWFVPMNTTTGKQVCIQDPDANREPPPPPAPLKEEYPEPAPAPPAYPGADPMPPPPPPPAPGFTAHEAPGGRTYWVNNITRATTWKDPFAERAPPPPPPPPSPPKERKKRRPPPPPESDSESESESSDDDDGEYRPGEEDWDELPKKVKKAAKRLGYKGKSWNNDDNDDLDHVEYDDLPKKLKRAAKKLGFDEDAWDEWFCESSSSSESESESDSDSDDERPRHGRHGGGGGRRGGGRRRPIMTNTAVHLSPKGLGQGTHFVMHSNMEEGGRMSYGGRDKRFSWTIQTRGGGHSPIRSGSKVVLRMNGNGNYMCTNAQEGGNLSIGSRSSYPEWSKYDTWTMETTDGGNVSVGSTIMLKSPINNAYWHSNSGEGGGFSWGGRNPALGWVIGPA